MPPTYYRGCWHVVGRGLFPGYRPYSSPGKGVYNPKAFILHAVSLGQAFAHCPRFFAAASRRSGSRVSVSLWLTIFSDQLPVLGLVGRYLTNYLIGREPLHEPQQAGFPPPTRVGGTYAGLATISRGYTPLKDRLLTRYSAVCRSPLRRTEGSRSTCMH